MPRPRHRPRHRPRPDRHDRHLHHYVMREIHASGVLDLSDTGRSYARSTAELDAIDYGDAEAAEPE